MEKEYKFAASPYMEGKLFEYVSGFAVGGHETVKMASVYYDTPERELA